MPRAEADISGGLPLFECSSFGLAPSKTCLQKQELNNFLVFHLLAAAILSGLCSIMQNLSVMCFMYIWRSFLLRAEWPKLTALSMRGGSTVCHIEFQFLRRDCKLSFLFTLLLWECLGRVCLQATEWNTVKSLFVSHTCFMIKNSLNKFATHDFLIIIISTTNYIFKVNESVINMFYTLIHIKYTK